MKKLNLEDILVNTSDLKKEKKVGYIAIIGRPNAGKSTFVNTLIGEKISITTNIPQTTRKRVLAIYNDEDSQIIFFDTPGIHKSEKRFNEKINEVAINSLKDSDLILYFIDSSRRGGEEEEFIKDIVSKTNKTVVTVYTKVDLTPPPSGTPFEKGRKTSSHPPAKDETGSFLEEKEQKQVKKEIVKISSVTKEGFDELLNKIKSHLKTGPILFPENIYTKQDIYFRISEIIREKVFLNTKEELPHSIYIGVEEIEDKEDILKIVAYIYTESDSQKYIVIGKNGTLVSKIGKESRLELEQIFEKKVFLALRVKVKKNWRKDEGLLKKLL